MEPLENTMLIDELRKEVRECWDRERAIIDALRDRPEMPPPCVLLFLSRASKWPMDYERKLGSEAIPFKTECECGAGMWFRIRQGIINSVADASLIEASPNLLTTLDDLLCTFGKPQRVEFLNQASFEDALAKI